MNAQYYFPRYEYIDDIKTFESNNSQFDHIGTDKFTKRGYYVVRRWDRENPYETYIHIEPIEHEIRSLEHDIKVAKEYLEKNKEINNNGMC